MKKTVNIIIIVALVGGLYYLTSGSKRPAERVVAENGTYCFSYGNQGQDFSEFRNIQVIVEDTDISGFKFGQSQSPEYTVAYQGVFEGDVSERGIVNVLFDYQIADGGRNRVEERYYFADETLVELEYSLTEDFENNILRIDETITETNGETFPRPIRYNPVNCPEELPDMSTEAETDGGEITEPETKVIPSETEESVETPTEETKE